MPKQMMRLCSLQMKNLLGINEFRYTKDASKKKRYLGLALVWILLIAMLVAYVAAYVAGMVMIGMEEAVPTCLYATVSILILVLTFFKAGSVLFSMKGYEVLVALPVSKTDIIVSRFLSMYLTNLLAGLLVMVPGCAVYAILVRPNAWFYVVSVSCALFLPMLPLTIASILGAAITALSSRSKHKSLGETLLMILVVVGIIVFSITTSGQAEQMDTDMLKDFTQTLQTQIEGIYPPACWYGNALSGDIAAWVMLLVIPTVIFTLFVAVLQKYYQGICSAINAVNAKNNYKMQQLHASGKVTALCKKELKRYFSSSVYVTNTIIGNVMAVVLMVALVFVDTAQLEYFMGVTNIEEILRRCIPFLIASLMSMNTMSASSISMEGNTFWQIQILPIQSRDVYNSKILASLIVTAPFYLLSVLLAFIKIRPSVWDFVWIIVIPACYVVFFAVFGLSVNLAFPVLNWESEVRAIKQSAATMVAMLLGMLSSVIPLLVSIFADEHLGNLISMVVVVLLAVLTGILYNNNNKKELIRLSQS